jgi:hypothetical protein
MPSIGVVELALVAVMILGIPALVGGLIYAVVRLAIRHERERSA